MSFDWKSLPELSAAVFVSSPGDQRELPLYLGPLAEELAIASAGDAVLAPLADLAWLRCDGADAKSFLHNQLTSDVNHLAPSSWQHSAWCTAKGRMLANFLLARQDDVYFLQMAGELRPAIAKRLAMYVLRSKIRVQETDEIASLGLAGSDAAVARVLESAGLPSPTDDHACVPFDGGWVARTAARRWQVTASVQRLPHLFAALATNARPVGLSSWHWLEIQSGLPIIDARTQEEFVPQMINFDKIGGVSFHKGCYPGQEVVARTQYLGKVKRHLYRVHAATPLQSGTTLQTSDAEGTHPVGVIACAAASPKGGFDALAVILESATSLPIAPAIADAPPLTSIEPVTA